MLHSQGWIWTFERKFVIMETSYLTDWMSSTFSWTRLDSSVTLLVTNPMLSVLSSTSSLNMNVAFSRSVLNIWMKQVFLCGDFIPDWRDFLHVCVYTVGEVGDIFCDDVNEPLVLILQSSVLFQDILHASGRSLRTLAGVLLRQIRCFLSQNKLI